MKFLLLLLLLLILISASSWASDKGNGGNAVVCREGTGRILSAELFDHFEGREMRRLNVVDDSLSHRAYFDVLASKVETYDPKNMKGFRAETEILLNAFEEYLTTGQNTSPDVVFTKNVLTYVGDMGHMVLQPNCRIEQLAVRVKREFPNDPRYLIQADIFKALSPRDVRGLIRHEVLYKMFIDNAYTWRTTDYYTDGGVNQYYSVNHTTAPKDSKTARFANQRIGSISVEDLDFKDYIDAVVNQNPMLERDGTRFNMQTVKPTSQGNGYHITSVDKKTEIIVDRQGRISGDLMNSMMKFNLSIYLSQTAEGFGRSTSLGFVKLKNADGSVISEAKSAYYGSKKDKNFGSTGGTLSAGIYEYEIYSPAPKTRSSYEYELGFAVNGVYYTTKGKSKDLIHIKERVDCRFRETRFTCEKI